MSSARFTLAALVLAGCVNTFGLAQVSLDDDRDGVLDDADNCPEDPNPRQQDFDRDGIGDHCSVCVAPLDRDDDGDGIDDACDECVGPGELDRDVGEDGIDDGCEPCPEATGQDLDSDGVDDACDSCLRGPPLDEDGDGVSNACDDCPSRPDPLQEQTMDTDRLGDACDPDTDPLGATGETTSQTQRMFDPFQGLPESWTQIDGTLGDGVAHLPAQGVAEAASRLTLFFLMETTVRFPTPAADATFEMLGQGIGQCPLVQPCDPSVSCVLGGDGHIAMKSFTDETFTSTTAVDVSTPVMLWLRSALSKSTGGISQICSAVDAHGTIVTVRQDDIGIPTGNIRVTPLFTAGPQPVDLHYMWLVAN